MSEFVISKSLQRDIDYIKSRTVTAKKCVFEIAWKLKDIADSNDLLDAGYKDIVEFAADNFGYSRSTTLNYVAISRKYLEMHKDAKDKPYLTTTCARIDDNERKCTEDYGIGQLNALGKTTADDFITMDSEGTISPSMTAKEIKDAVKKFYDDVKPEQDPDTDTEPEQDPEDKEYTRTLTLTEMVTCLCCELIGEEYDIEVDTAIDDAFQNLTKGEYRLEFIYNAGHEIEFVRVWKHDDKTPCMTYPSENI